MSTEIHKQCGVVFQDVSIDDAAQKCASLAAYWGGLAMVFVDPSGLVEAMIPGTIYARRAAKHRAADLVGTYDVNRKSVANGRRLIAVDIWQHMVDQAGAESRGGQRIRAQWMQSETSTASQWRAAA
jgi:hypothetical protein